MPGAKHPAPEPRKATIDGAESVWPHSIGKHRDVLIGQAMMAGRKEQAPGHTFDRGQDIARTDTALRSAQEQAPHALPPRPAMPSIAPAPSSPGGRPAMHNSRSPGLFQRIIQMSHQIVRRQIYA